MPFTAVSLAVAAALQPRLPIQPMPIQTRNHRAIALAFLRMPLAGPALGKGERAWEVGLTTANDFRSRPGMFEDAEIDRLEVLYRMGWQKNRELWFSGALLNRGGGFLDPIIDWWHRNILGWTDKIRDITPYGGSTILLDGEYQFGSAAGLGDVTVGLTQTLNPRLSASVALKLPTGDAARLMGSGAPDLGVSVDYRFPIARKFSGHAQVGVVLQGKATRLPATRSLIDQECLALIYTPNSRDSWIVQWQSERAPITTGARGADASHRLVTFGFRRQMSARETIELYFSEDRDLFNGKWPEGANVGPDFTAGVRYGWKF